MPKYRITEYRGVNLVGFAASSTSTIYAKDIFDARLIATCINTPKGEWQYDNGRHIIGSLKEGNMSIVIQIANRPEYKEIKDKSTRIYLENNIIDDKTFKHIFNQIQKGYVIRPSPYYRSQIALYHPEKGCYLPTNPS